jgi:hypothetical protein
MKKNIWRPLQIAWLVLAMFTAYNSILALDGDASYCSGIYCESNNDCESPCACDRLDSTCYNTIQSTT